MFVENPSNLPQEAIDELKRILAMSAEALRIRYQQLIDDGVQHEDLVGFIVDDVSDEGMPLIVVNVLEKSQVSLPIKIVSGDPEHDAALERVLSTALVTKAHPLLHVAVMTSRVTGTAVVIVGVSVSKGGSA